MFSKTVKSVAVQAAPEQPGSAFAAAQRPAVEAPSRATEVKTASVPCPFVDWASL